MLFALALASVLELVEVRVNAPSDVYVEIVAMTSGLDAEERLMLPYLAEDMRLGSVDFPAKSIRELTEGRPYWVTLGPDHVRISLSVNGTSAPQALALAESLLKRPAWATSTVVPTLSSDPWELFRPRQHLSGRPPEVRWRAAGARLLTPARTCVAVASAHSTPLRPGWISRMEDWKVTDPTRRLERALPQNPVRRDGDTLTLTSKPFPSGDAAWSAKFLVAVAMGAGKASLLHRVWRESQRWSYRQEAAVTAAEGGWTLILRADMPGDFDRVARGAEAKKATQDGIEAWTEADLSHAKSLADSQLRFGIGLGSRWLSGRSPVGNDPAERAYFAAYWQAKTGQGFDQERLLAGLNLVNLRDFKEQARSLVESMEADWG